MKQVVLITGSAKGIGKAIAIELAKCGCDIAINYYQSESEAHALKEELIQKYNVRAICVQCDVAHEEEVDRMVTRIEKELGYVSVLVNNAAVDLSNLFYQKTIEEFRRTLDVNVIGAYNCARRVAPHMKEVEYGRIVNITSTNGMNTYYPMSIDYDASKAAMISLTHNLAIQLSPYIHVNAVAPGFIGTENELDGYDEEFLKQECEKILVERYGEPEEVAHLVKFLISDDANYINNTVIRIDGGQAGSI